MDPLIEDFFLDGPEVHDDAPLSGPDLDPGPGKGQEKKYRHNNQDDPHWPLVR
jgi:hypothetical protein